METKKDSTLIKVAKAKAPPLKANVKKGITPNKAIRRP